ERAEELERVAETVGDSLEHGAAEGATVVAQRETDERAARVGVCVRRPLALEVGEEEEALGTGLPGCGGGGELVVRGTRSTGVAKPTKRHRCVEHHAHRLPRVRNGVAERVHTGERVVYVGGKGREYDAGRAEHDRDETRLDHADAERGCLLIARAGDLGRLVG